jgi:hypothetical protein
MSWWKIGFGWCIGLGSVSFVGSARADVEGDPQAVTGTPHPESWARLELGLRTGYGIPIGKAFGNAAADLNELVSGQGPIWVDVGARVNGHVTFGLYYSYGFGLVGSYLRETCDLLQASAADGTVDVSCYVRNHRVGLQAGYHFAPQHDFDPWLALGIGHEFFDFTLSSTSASASASTTSTLDADGIEYVNLQIGLDYRLGEHLRAGPFLGLTTASYGTLSRSCHGGCGIAGSSAGDISNRSSHGWLFLGIRGVALL